MLTSLRAFVFLATVLAVTPPAAALAADPSISVTPSSGAPGTMINVSGSGFAAGEQVNITWDGTQVTSAITDASGNLSASFQAPNGSGSHQIAASGVSSQVSSTTSFGLPANPSPSSSGATSSGGASLSINPTFGPAGLQVNLSGSGYSASEQINFAADGNVFTSIISDGNGNFNVNLFLPSNLSLGNHSVSATGASSGHSASVTFDVTSTSVVTQPGGGREGLACTAANIRPGRGLGDRNHCHTGRRGEGNDDEGDD